MQDTDNETVTHGYYEGGHHTNDKKKPDDDEKIVDFKRAMQNLSDIMIDSSKFKFMVQTLYYAIDTENVGSIQCHQVEEFCRDFLQGDGSYDVDTNFANHQDSAYKMLRDSESGKGTLDELSKFLWELTR